MVPALIWFCSSSVLRFHHGRENAFFYFSMDVCVRDVYMSRKTDEKESDTVTHAPNAVVPMWKTFFSLNSFENLIVG